MGDPTKREAILRDLSARLDAMASTIDGYQLDVTGLDPSGVLTDRLISIQAELIVAAVAMRRAARSTT